MVLIKSKSVKRDLELILELIFALISLSPTKIVNFVGSVSLSASSSCQDASYYVSVSGLFFLHYKRRLSRCKQLMGKGGNVCFS